MEFELPVSGEKVKTQQVTALHLFSSLAFIGTGAIVYVYNFQITYWGLALLVMGMILLVLSIFRNRWVTKKMVSRSLRVVELAFSIIVAIYSYAQQWTFPVIIFTALTATILFALYWERGAGQKMVVHIDKRGIKMPATSRKGFIEWHEIEQVLLKYGVLSIDCVDNKLYQFDVSAYKGDNYVFEAYCQEQVLANVNKRINNDW